MKLPAVIAIDNPDENEIVLGIQITPDLEAFRGHFPDNPVLPGVVQIDWVMQFAASHFGISNPSARNFQVKFRNIIRPEMPVSLTLSLDRPKMRLSFTYKSGETLMSSGQMKL